MPKSDSASTALCGTAMQGWQLPWQHWRCADGRQPSCHCSACRKDRPQRHTKTRNHQGHAVTQLLFKGFKLEKAFLNLHSQAKRKLVKIKPLACFWPMKRHSQAPIEPKQRFISCNAPGVCDLMFWLRSKQLGTYSRGLLLLARLLLLVLN